MNWRKEFYNCNENLLKDWLEGIATHHCFVLLLLEEAVCLRESLNISSLCCSVKAQQRGYDDTVLAIRCRTCRINAVLGRVGKVFEGRLKGRK